MEIDKLLIEAGFTKLGDYKTGHVSYMHPKYGCMLFHLPPNILDVLDAMLVMGENKKTEEFKRLFNIK